MGSSCCDPPPPAVIEAAEPTYSLDPGFIYNAASSDFAVYYSVSGQRTKNLDA
jgi:hypothetical protein